MQVSLKAHSPKHGVGVGHDQQLRLGNVRLPCGPAPGEGAGPEALIVAHPHPPALMAIAAGEPRPSADRRLRLCRHQLAAAVCWQHLAAGKATRLQCSKAMATTDIRHDAHLVAFMVRMAVSTPAPRTAAVSIASTCCDGTHMVTQLIIRKPCKAARSANHTQPSALSASAAARKMAPQH